MHSLSHSKPLAGALPWAERARWSPARAGLTLLLLGALVWSVVSFGAVPGLLALARGLGARPELLAVFVVTYAAAFALRAWAWRLTLRSGPTVARLCSILHVALLANHVFPTKVGELIRVGLLARTGVPVGAAASSTLLARLLDYAALLAIALGVGLLAGGQAELLLLGMLAPLGAVAAAGLLYLGLRRGMLMPCLMRLRRGVLAPYVGCLPARLASLARQAEAAVAAPRPLSIAAALALVVPAWLLEAGALWSVGQAAGVSLSVQVAIAATAITIAFQAFQVTPGGIGLYEASLTGALALFGVDPATGLSLALATHALKFAYSYAVGVPCLATEALADVPTAQRAGAVLVERLVQPATQEARSVERLVRLATRALLDPAALALGAALVATFLAWLAFRADAVQWSSLAIGLLVSLPLILLAKCHHLPARVQPGLALVPLAFGLSFGLSGLPAAMVAAGLAVVLYPLARFREHLDAPRVGKRSTAAGWPLPAAGERNAAANGPLLAAGERNTATSWPLLAALAAMLALAIDAGAAQPIPVLIFGLAALALLLLLRQWWLSRHPLAAGEPLSAGTIAVVIPVHNEAATLGAVVAAVPRADLRRRGLQAHVVVVDDGSSDDSASAARAAGADSLVHHPRRRGLGAALRSGLDEAQRLGATAAVYLDGDGEYNPADIPAVLAPVLAGQADYVLGVRRAAANGRVRLARRVGNVAFTLLVQLLCGRRLRDAQTGMRAFSARALARAEIIHDYNYAQVLTLDLLRKRLRLAEVPITYRLRQHGASFIRYHEYALRVLPAIVREVLAP